MYAQYKSHDDATFSYLEDSLCHSHTFKDVFLLGQAGSKAKPKGNALRTELMKKGNVDEDKNAETWTLSKKRRDINTWRDYICHEIDVSQEFDADINFPQFPLHVSPGRIDSLIWSIATVFCRQT